MISVRNLNFSYADDQMILQDINLEIEDGQYVAVIGANGSGKTTLIRHFNALLRPASGDVLVNGLSTRYVKSHPEIRRMIGMIFQNPDNQMVGMTVEEDVAFGPGNLGLSSAEIRKRVDEALEKVGLSEYKTRPPHTLSGGQKQLLAIAGVLAMDSRFIVLDEPTSSLDPESRFIVLEQLKQLNQEGIGIIHVTHNMDELANAHRVLVLEKGKLAADGAPGDIFRRVEWLRDLGLAPPKITELIWYLRQKGFDIREGLFSIQQAGDEIISLMNAHRLKAVNM
ncbi:MAG TPA: energy-coupling factor transporter ATPase [Syntrophomonadaceae bacterium]|jgi:energy-coupling factor transporter ATPase|nr:energy-coupling factor transporter ATPase [Syntrophomonadaceae bacterium]HRX22298.1 energy-coupling factor transporter ATPase [Syntrophomonadaceae bacterium]